LFIIVIGREWNADFSATNGNIFSVRILSRSFKIILFQVHVHMADLLITSSILLDKMMHSQVWSVLIWIRRSLGLAQAMQTHLWEIKYGLSK
jgi:hypothetical protein